MTEEQDTYQYLIIIKSLEELESCGYGKALQLLDDYPSLRNGPVKVTKLNGQFYLSTSMPPKLIYEYMVKEVYTESEGIELFPQCYI